MENPYRWHLDNPSHVVSRDALLDDVIAQMRRGNALKLVGGRGMGKSVALRLLEQRFASEPGTRVVRLHGPPEEPTMAAAVRAIARGLGVASPEDNSLDVLMEDLSKLGATRVVALIDEVDQYVLLDGTGNFARIWFNRIETLRKAWPDQFSVLIAGGVGLLHVSHVLGSGLVSRAEERVMRPFTASEMVRLCEPLERRGVRVDPISLEVLRSLSGGNPALATWGLAQAWEEGAATRDLFERSFTSFREGHSDFVRAVHDGVSRRGMVGAPARVLSVVQAFAGEVPQRALREACAGDESPIDVGQALKVLIAAGLVDVDESMARDPVHARLVASILNMEPAQTIEGDVLASVTAHVASALGQMHRFGRDFHDDDGLLQEQVFSSMLAVALGQVGWRRLVALREPIQRAGFPDLRVEQRGGAGHVVIETKIWPRNDYTQIQQQIDDYTVSDTRHAIAVMIGDRKVDGWAREYEAKCLSGCSFTALPTPPDLVGAWRVERVDSEGLVRRTDHLLVQVSKRR